MTSDDSAIPSVAAAEAVAGSASGIFLLDVREQWEWDAGHSPDAVLIPLPELESRHGELPAGRELLVICHSGARSSLAVRFLRGVGLDAVNVDGGMMGWERVGGKIATD